MFVAEQRPIAAPASCSRAETQSPPGGTTPTRELEGSQTQMDVLSESFSKTVQVKILFLKIKNLNKINLSLCEACPLEVKHNFRVYFNNFRSGRE